MQKDRGPNKRGGPWAIFHFKELSSLSLVSSLLGMSVELKVFRAGVPPTGKPPTSAIRQCWSWWAGTAKSDHGANAGRARRFDIPTQRDACEDEYPMENKHSPDSEGWKGSGWC